MLSTENGKREKVIDYREVNHPESSPGPNNNEYDETREMDSFDSHHNNNESESEIQDDEDPEEDSADYREGKQASKQTSSIIQRCI